MKIRAYVGHGNTRTPPLFSVARRPRWRNADTPAMPSRARGEAAPYMARAALPLDIYTYKSATYYATPWRNVFAPYHDGLSRRQQPALRAYYAECRAPHGVAAHAESFYAAMQPRSDENTFVIYARAAIRYAIRDERGDRPRDTARCSASVVVVTIMGKR